MTKKQPMYFQKTHRTRVGQELTTNLDGADEQLTQSMRLASGICAARDLTAAPNVWPPSVHALVTHGNLYPNKRKHELETDILKQEDRPEWQVSSRTQHLEVGNK